MPTRTARSRAVEFETFLGGEFKKADKNGDGGVTFDEASAYKFTWREKVEKMLAAGRRMFSSLSRQAGMSEGDR